MSNSSQHRILIADDFNLVRAMVKRALSDMGCADVTEAENGQEALNLLRDGHSEGRPFTMLVCDWNMPHLSGLELVRRLRAMPEFASLKIVMLTAESEQKSVVEAARAGASGYIVKPISKEILETKLGAYLKSAA